MFFFPFHSKNNYNDDDHKFEVVSESVRLLKENKIPVNGTNIRKLGFGADTVKFFKERSGIVFDYKSPKKKLPKKLVKKSKKSDKPEELKEEFKEEPVVEPVEVVVDVVVEVKEKPVEVVEVVDDNSSLDGKHNGDEKFVLEPNQKIIIGATPNRWKKAQTKRAKELVGADKVLDSEADWGTKNCIY